MVEQKSAPDLLDQASDEQFLPYDFSTRVSVEAGRAKNTRDGVRTELNIKELIDSEFTVFDPAYVAHRKERQSLLNRARFSVNWACCSGRATIQQEIPVPASCILAPINCMRAERGKPAHMAPANKN
jgi:hypothetical protein